MACSILPSLTTSSLHLDNCFADASAQAEGPSTRQILTSKCCSCVQMLILIYKHVYLYQRQKLWLVCKAKIWASLRRTALACSHADVAMAKAHQAGALRTLLYLQKDQRTPWQVLVARAGLEELVLFKEFRLLK